MDFEKFLWLLVAMTSVYAFVYPPMRKWFLNTRRGQRIEREVHHVEEMAKDAKETVKEKLTDSLPDVIPHIKELKEEIQREIHQELVRDGLEEDSEVHDKYKKNFQRIIKESSESNTKVFEIDEEPNKPTGKAAKIEGPLFTEVAEGEDPLFSSASAENVTEQHRAQIREDLLEETPVTGVFSKPIFDTSLSKRKAVLETTRR